MVGVLTRKGPLILPCAITPTRTSSLEQFPGDSYSNIRKLSKGFRGLRGGWERYAVRESEVVVTGERLAHCVTKVCPTRFQRTFTAVPLAETMSIPWRMIS